MNQQERETLTNLLAQLNAAKLESKDPEADTLIKETCNHHPDASYLLVQRILLLEKAWQDAQSRINTLQAELSPSRVQPSSGFLDGNSWGRPAAGNMSQSGPVSSSSQILPSSPPWGSGILGNVATTVAGVVAGSFLFRGIEHLMNDHGSGWLSTGGAAQSPISETTVINNYYDTDPSGDLDAASLPDSSDLIESEDWV